MDPIQVLSAAVEGSSLPKTLRIIHELELRMKNWRYEKKVHR